MAPVQQRQPLTYTIEQTHLIWDKTTFLLQRLLKDTATPKLLEMHMLMAKILAA